MTKMTGEKTLLRIFFGESDRYHHRPLHEALLEFFKKKGFAGATVIHGSAGFGASSIIHTDKILRLSSDLPIILEIVDDEEKINASLPELDEMIGNGLVTMEKVKVILYRHNK